MTSLVIPEMPSEIGCPLYVVFIGADHSMPFWNANMPFCGGCHCQPLGSPVPLVPLMMVLVEFHNVIDVLPALELV